MKKIPKLFKVKLSIPITTEVIIKVDTENGINDPAIIKSTINYWLDEIIESALNVENKGSNIKYHNIEEFTSDADFPENWTDESIPFSLDDIEDDIGEILKYIPKKKKTSKVKVNEETDVERKLDIEL